MADKDPSPRLELPITTRAGLVDALDAVIRSAYANGVPVNDMGYDLRHDDPKRVDWEVRIVQLQ